MADYYVPKFDRALNRVAMVLVQPGQGDAYVSAKDYERALEQVQRLLNHCADAECDYCSAVICDRGDPCHFHHDGCPSCHGARHG